MKRVVISVIILFSVIGLGIGSQFYLVHTKEKAVSMVETALESVERGDLPAARIQILEFSDYWEKEEKYLTIFVRHQQIEELSVLTASLEPMLACGNIAEYYVTNAQVMKLLEMIIESERPTFSTVLSSMSILICQ